MGVGKGRRFLGDGNGRGMAHDCKSEAIDMSAKSLVVLGADVML